MSGLNKVAYFSQATMGILSVCSLYTLSSCSVYAVDVVNGPMDMYICQSVEFVINIP